MNPKTFDQIFKYIQQANNILLTIHRGHDGDALGSITAMIDLLEKHNTNYCAFLHEKPKKDFNNALWRNWRCFNEHSIGESSEAAI